MLSILSENREKYQFTVLVQYIQRLRQRVVVSYGYVIAFNNPIFQIIRLNRSASVLLGTPVAVRTWLLINSTGLVQGSHFFTRSIAHVLLLGLCNQLIKRRLSIPLG